MTLDELEEKLKDYKPLTTMSMAGNDKHLHYMGCVHYTRRTLTTNRLIVSESPLFDKRKALKINRLMKKIVEVGELKGDRGVFIKFDVVTFSNRGKEFYPRGSLTRQAKEIQSVIFGK